MNVSLYFFFATCLTHENESLGKTLFAYYQNKPLNKNSEANSSIRVVEEHLLNTVSFL